MTSVGGGAILAAMWPHAWIDLRDDPLRRELLAGLLADRREVRDRALAALTRGAADERRAALSELFTAVLAVEHLEWIESRRPSPFALELRVALGTLGADEAVARLDLSSAAGLEVFARLGEGCGAETLAAALDRVPWSGYLPIRSDELGPVLRRGVELGLGARTLERLAGSDLLTRVVPELGPERRAAALRDVLGQLAREADPLRVLARALELLPILGAEERDWLRVARPELPLGLDEAGLLRWGEPHLAAAWAAALCESGWTARLEGLERCVAALGPRLDPARAEAWLAEVIAATRAGEDALYRLQSGAPALEVAARRLAELPPLQACEGLTWIAWGWGEPAASRALEAWIDLADPSPAAAILLERLLVRLDPSRRAAAAERLLAAPGRTPVQELRALCHLPGRRTQALAALRVWTFGDVDLAFTAAGVMPLLASFLEVLEGDARGQVEEVALRRVAAASGSRRAAELAALAPALTPARRATLAREALAAPEGMDDPDVIACLPTDEMTPALAAAARRAFALPRWERWQALGRLAEALPGGRGDAWLRRLFLEREASGEAEPDELVALPRRVLDPALARRRIARELAEPGPYSGWLLGELARVLPEGERGPVLDAALAAFDRIALTPTGPGNDAGPFVALADLLDAERARRALAITERMAAAPWGSDLVAARHALHLRLVALGDRASELELLRSGDPWALGELLALRLRRGEPWSSAAAVLATLPEPDQEARFEVLRTLLRALGPAAIDAGLAAGLAAAFVELEDPELRSAGVTALVLAAGEGLPPERAHDLVRAQVRGADAILLRLTLAERLVARAPERAAGLLHGVLAELTDDAVDDAIAPLCRLRAHVPAEALAGVLGRWLADPRARGSTLLAACTDEELARALASGLLHLGGPTVLVAITAGIEDLTRTLA